MTKQLTLEKVQEAQALFEKLENDLAILLQDKEEQIKADLSGQRDALSEAYDEARDDFQLSSECLLEAPGIGPTRPRRLPSSWPPSD